MENLLLFLPFLIPAVVAQFGERQGWARYVTYGLLVALNLTLLGAVALFLTNQLAKVFWPELMNSESMEVHWLALAVTCLLTSMAAFVPLILPVRRWLARWMPIDPNSTVHTTALTFAVYQIGLSLGQLILIGDLENLTEAELALTLWDVLLSGVPFALFALVGVGLFVRRDGQSTLERLGLRRPTWRQLLAATGLIILFLAFDMGVSLLWEELDPAGYDLLERVSENLFGNLTTVGGAIALGLSAGISEELLFRGAVQPRLGLLLATILFAVGHIQYGLTLATLQIFVIGLVLGVLRTRSGTTICILIHAGYNTVGTLLELWLS
jgi:membrane protease YdiL (CAAX protease family)